MAKISLVNAAAIIAAVVAMMGPGIWAFQSYPVKTFLLGTGILTVFGALASGRATIAAHEKGPAWATSIFGCSTALLLGFGTIITMTGVTAL